MNTAVPRPHSNEGFLNFGFIVLGAFIALGLLVWASGEVASRLSGNGGLGLSFDEMGGVLIQLLKDPGHASSAFPSGKVGGTSTFYLSLAALMIGCSVAVIAALKILGRFRQGTSTNITTSSWATPHQLQPLVVKGPEPGRVILGRSGQGLLAAEQRQSVIVLGPTQSMKTTGFAIPAILEWQGPVVATSVKTDLLRETLEARRAMGELWIYDPTSTTGLPAATWSPLQFCSDWHGAQRTATWLARAAQSDASGISDADFWYQAAAKLLAPIMYAAARSGRSMRDVVAWVDTQDENELKRILMDLGGEDPLRAAQSAWMKEPRQKSSIYTTAETVLMAYSDPIVASSAEGFEISPDRLLDGGNHTLFITAPSHEQKRLKPLFETLVQSIIGYTYARASITGEPLDPPILLVLDEAANIAPLKDLDTLASTAAGQGIQLVTIWQDLSQISRIYGQAANTVVNNHRAKVVLSGISDPPTLDYVSHLLGDEEVKYSSVTTNAQGDTSRTESTGYRKLAPAHALRSIKPGEGILVYGHLPPSQLKLRPWFKEKSLLKLVNESKPQQLSIDVTA
jgi:type IV secretion system protein VirD4